MVTVVGESFNFDFDFAVAVKRQKKVTVSDLNFTLSEGFILDI